MVDDRERREALLLLIILFIILLFNLLNPPPAKKKIIIIRIIINKMREQKNIHPPVMSPKAGASRPRSVGQHQKNAKNTQYGDQRFLSYIFVWKNAAEGSFVLFS